MSSITRQIISVDMLSQELTELAEALEGGGANMVSDEYLKLLAQFARQMHILSDASGNETENSFCQALLNSHTCQHIKSKQMLMIHCRLLDFILDYYHANGKANQLLRHEFGDLADQRLDLLQTKAIKARSQHKTVAQALGKLDYQAFIRHAGLADEDWGWDALRID